MSKNNDRIIKHKLRLFNLTDELGNVFKTRQNTGVS